MTLVSLRSANDVSYVTGIKHASQRESSMRVILRGRRIIW